MKKEKALQELLEVLDPYVLLTFKGTQEKRKKLPRSGWRCWILTSSLLLKELLMFLHRRRISCSPQNKSFGVVHSKRLFAVKETRTEKLWSNVF